jgi:hypothetical protein
VESFVMSRVLMACSGLLLAVVVADGARPVPASAQPASTRVRWEYKLLTPTAIEALSGKEPGAFLSGLNKLGEDGWELVAIEPGHVPAPVRLPRYLFKRPK